MKRSLFPVLALAVLLGCLGDVLFMSWQLDEPSVKTYFSTDGYQEPSGGVEGTEVYTYSRP